jgi:rare lipoprotein A
MSAPEALSASTALSAAAALSPRRRLATLAFGSIMLLSACAGPRSPAPAPGASRSDPSLPAASGRRGGYYADDGPGESLVAPDPQTIPDAQPRREPLARQANRPYVVFGRSYVPMAELIPWRERGIASWYGRKFHGLKTASGETYDMYGMTAAHPTLPIPSYARVTNLRTGQSVVVRVNDRGPFLHDRVIDLSWTAAARLGYVQAGIAEVEVELVTRFDDTEDAPLRVAQPEIEPRLSIEAMPPSSSQAETVASLPVAPSSAVSSPVVSSPVVPAQSVATVRAGVWLQLGAFGSRDNAEAARSRLARQLDWLATQLDVVPDGGMFKVQAGPFGQRGEAVAAAERIRAATTFKPFATIR